jgi:hypothetical protein
MSRTVTAKPDDKSMWRKLLARAHPDAGGDDALFVWANNVREKVCAGRLPRPRPEPRYETPTYEPPARVPYPTAYLDFGALTRATVEVVAEQVGEPFCGLLKLLADCEPTIEQTGHLRGASYKQLALIAHTVGMTKEQRKEWYRIAEGVPLSELHARHLIAKLEGGKR